MKYWLFLFGILIAGPIFAQCKIDQQQFGVSSATIEQKLEYSKTLERIPNVQKEVITIFEDVCPKLEETLARDTDLSYHFIKDQLVAIELERPAHNDLLLFEWARRYFGIMEDRDINEQQQLIQVEEADRLIQLFLGILPDAVFQNVALISSEHDDLFELLANKEDVMDWETYEYPASDGDSVGEGN